MPYCGFNLHFFNGWWCQHLFMCLAVVYRSSLKKCLICCLCSNWIVCFFLTIEFLRLCLFVLFLHSLHINPLSDSPFQCICYLFPFLALLHWLELPIMLNKSSESRHPSLVPNLRRKTSSLWPLSIISGVVYI